MAATTIACGSGYLGDRPCAGLTLAATRAAQVVVFEALAEATLGTFALRRRAQEGFSRRFLDRMAPAMASLTDGGAQVVSSAGICDPAGAGDYLSEQLRALGVGARVVSVIGDELEGFRPAAPPLDGTLLGSFAYLGARDLLATLADSDHDVLITGRTTDTALYLLPLLQRHPSVSPDTLAHWAVAGHLAECAGHVTGGNYSGPGWRDIDYTRLGHAVISADDRPSVTIAPTPGLDGFVNAGTVTEQLLYETTDPANFLTPDVIVDFSRIQMTPLEDGGVAISGVRGYEATGLLRVLSYYLRGEIVELEIAYGWPDAEEKARRAAEIVHTRCARILGSAMPEPEVSVFGVDALFGAVPPGLAGSEVEVKARLAFRSPDPEVSTVLIEEAGSLYDCGPPGASDIAGPTAGNPASVRPWIEVAEDFVPRDLVSLSVVEHGHGKVR